MITSSQSLGRIRLHGWLLLFRTLFVRRARRTRQRPTHATGIAARGEATLVASGRPPHDVLAAGRALSATIRHANLRFDDDAAVDIRGAGLRISDGDRVLLDMPMNTGRVSAFWDTDSFVAFVRASAKGTKEALQLFLDKNPSAWPGTIGGLCRAPESYCGLEYCSQLVYRYRASDGGEWIVRYRLIPQDRDGQGGLVGTDAEQPWESSRLPSEVRPKDYLRKELRERVSRGEARYRFQGQFRRPGEDPSIYHSGLEWDAADHPWQDIATITLRSMLSDAETAALGLALANNPASLGILEPVGPADYNSLAWYRHRLYPISQRARTAAS
jgi:hypothetical protein